MPVYEGWAPVADLGSPKLLGSLLSAPLVPFPGDVGGVDK